MGKALMVIRPSTSIVSGDEINLFGTQADSAAEAQAQVSATHAATFSNLRFNIISGGSGTNNFRFRVDSANGNMLATRSGVGVAEDTSNTDALTASQVFAVAYTDTGTDSTYAWGSANVEFASGHGNYHGSARYASQAHDLENTTRFLSLSGNLRADGIASEANAQWKVRGYDTFAGLQVRVFANARTNTTSIKNRINGFDGGLSCDFGAGVTGLVIDTSPADSLVDGDLINASITLGSGTEAISLTLCVATLTSSSNKSEIWAASDVGLARTASATATYHPIGGYHTTSTLTEAQSRIEVGFAASVSNLRCYLSDNTYTGDGTLKLMQNGTAVLTTTLTAGGGAGWYENTSDTITIDDNDELSFEIDEGTSGSITVWNVGITFSPLTGNVSSTGESVATLSGASTAEAPITSAGESVVTLSTASIAEAPITAAGEAAATFSGESDVPAEGRLSVHGESVATLAGASITDGAVTSTAEAIATLEGASLVAGAINSAGESLATLEGIGTVIVSGDFSSEASASLTMRGAGGEDVDGPSWYHGTSRRSLKDPWKKKRRKGPDDDEFMTILNYALSVTKRSSRPPQ